jgi:hypothetical protein
MQEYVGKYGNVTDFWLDGIKSSALITVSFFLLISQYETPEEALEAKRSLAGQHYPDINKKTLETKLVTLLAATRHQENSPASVRGRDNARDKRQLDQMNSVVRNSLDRSVPKRSAPNSAPLSKSASAVWESRGERTSAGTLGDKRIERESGKTRSERESGETTGSIEKEEKVDAYKIPDLPGRVPVDDLYKRTETAPALYYLPVSSEEVEKRRFARRGE